MVRVLVRQCETNGSSLWDEFVTCCENATYYQLSKWTQAVNVLPGQDIRRIIAFLCDGQIVGGLTLAVKERAGLRIATKPWATPYCGIMYRAKLPAGLKSKINEALSKYLSNTYDRIHIEASTNFKDVLAFQKDGWHLSVKCTYTLTKTDATLMEQIEPSVRRQVRKAKRRQLRIDKAKDPIPFYEMYYRCYERLGIRLAFDLERFKQFYGRLASDAHSAIWYAREHDQVVAGMLVNTFNGHHYYTLAAFFRDRSELAAPSLLIYDYLEHEMQPGEVFDFIGANTYTAGVTQFKRKFNPIETPYFVLERRSWRYRLCSPSIKIIKGTERLFHS